MTVIEVSFKMKAPVGKLSNEQYRDWIEFYLLRSIGETETDMRPLRRHVAQVDPDSVVIAVNGYVLPPRPSTAVRQQRKRED